MAAPTTLITFSSLGHLQQHPLTSAPTTLVTFSSLGHLQQHPLTCKSWAFKSGLVAIVLLPVIVKHTSIRPIET
ncbi:hypothetical protein GIB67_017871 [Kingdonia uniflora]|uniref:Uncharacterized protein n=1 Tax=Kingdonia uniflora TaxID=39325 RepID=A0A7J7MKW0_9MAGN|nr:hypothetical protein GIB67_017871 [Kingdonia uniflora]